jgi:hypothetical protein
MSVLTLRPNAASVTELSQYPADGDRYQKVDEATLDETDYVYNAVKVSQSTKTDIYGFSNHSSESGTINSVTLKCKAKYIITGATSVNSTVNPSVKIGTTVYGSGAQNLTNSTAEYSYAWTTNPATSEAWSWTNIDDLLAGIALSNGYTDKDNVRNPYCYQLWVEVDYTEGGGSTAKSYYYYLQQ